MTDAHPSAGTPVEGTVVPFTGIRGAVARAMTGAWGAPRVAVAFDVELDACLALRRARQEEAGEDVRLSPTHFILRAAALALRDHPGLNGTVHDDGVHLSATVDIGLAVSIDGGLIVPVIRAVDAKPVEVVAREAAELAQQARSGGLRQSALRGGTFTVSTLGATGAAWFTPILNAPQVAILGVGAIQRRAVVRGDDVVPASMTTLTVIFDHRAVDGQPAATFLAAIRDRLEHPDEL